MTGAAFAISEAVWAAGDFRKKVVEAPPRERAPVRVSVRTVRVLARRAARARRP